MWSIGGAALLLIASCAVAVALAVRKAHAEIGPTLQSFDALRTDVRDAIGHTSRDTGRVRASHQVLVRHGNPSTPR
jgi:hypothetical protein